MKYMIVFALCLLATLKVSFQSAYGRKYISTKTDIILYNCFVFTAAALTFCQKILGCSKETIIYGCVFGLFSFVFQINYTNALSIGNVSLSAMIVNFYMIFPICVSMIVYNEKLSLFKIMGITLVIISFVMGVQFKKCEKSNTKKWLINILCAFAANGMLSVTQQIFAKSQYSSEKDAFISCAYIFSAGACWVIYLKIRKKAPLSPVKNIVRFKYTLLIGGLLALFQLLNTYAVSVIEGTVLFPTYAGGAMILSTLSGVLIFKDNLLLNEKIGIGVGIVAVVIMNL